MNERRINIITSVYSPEVGGPGVYLASLKEVLEKRGYAVAVLVRPGFFTLLSKIKNNDVVLAHATPKILLPVYIARFAKRFSLTIRIGGDFFWERAVEEGRYFGTLRDFYRSRNFQFPISNFQTSAPLRVAILYWVMKFLLRRADAVVFTASLLRDIYVPLFELDEKKVHTIMHPILELRPISSSSTKSVIRNSQLNNSSQTKSAIRLLYAGRFLKLKNLHMLLEVFAEARKKHPNIHLTLIGEGPEGEALKAISHKLKAGDAVIFKDPTSHDNILEEMSRSDLVVLPSLSEVSPNLLTDALAAGAPVLATQENGLYGIFKESATWFNPMSKEDFSAKLEALLVPGALDELREKKKTHLQQRTWSEVAEEYENVFQQSV
ncbi:MAG: glycosyltransferase family 4 protein [bacterium]|nr:glycosyltransferase family 4 protein [bacterium]